MKKIVAICACAVVGTNGMYAVASTEEHSVAIDRYPSVIRFRGTPLLHGHTDASNSSVVELQKRKRGTTVWKVINERKVGATPRVKFRLKETRFTADYRYVVEGAASDPVRIRVRPRVRVHARPTKVLEGRRATIRGILRPAVRGRSAVVKWRVRGTWRRLASVRVGDGRFKVRAKANRYGRRPVKVVFSGDRLNSYGRDRTRLRVHRPSLATWYGPGFFGRRTACGQTYRRDLLGVAHRTLRCGTKVSVLYRGRSVEVPVVDRGPYGSASWDLTEETAHRLGFRGREEIGVLH